jgi:hypothetical protein
MVDLVQESHLLLNVFLAFIVLEEVVDYLQDIRLLNTVRAA